MKIFIKFTFQIVRLGVTSARIMVYPPGDTHVAAETTTASYRKDSKRSGALSSSGHGSFGPGSLTPGSIDILEVTT